MKPLALALLLFAGIAAGALTHGAFAPLFGTLTLDVFIPALIFEAAWALDIRVVRANARPIVLLALPGVALTAGVIACGARLAGLPWQSALALGAILSATDPIAVVAIFKRLNVPEALATIVESESLLNDALAVVLFRTVLASAAFATFAATAGVVYSAAIGALAAWIGSLVLRRTQSVAVHVVATVTGAYGTYVLCERIGGTGIFGVLTFAIALRALERTMTQACSRGVDGFWTLIAVAANGVLFFLLGAAVDIGRLGAWLPLIGATAAAVLLARIALAYGLLQLAREYVRLAWMHVVRMAGVRGALSVALAIALPASVAQRSGLIAATFAVAVITIALGALTYERRVERLDLGDA